MGCACQTAQYNSGASEPIQVRDASFHVGELVVDEDATTPAVIYATAASFIVTQGQGNIGYGGVTSTDTFSVGVAFPGVGTGYWVVPVDGPDVTQDGALIFDLTVDFTPEVPYGLQDLRFVAFDGDGYVGPSYDTTLCILPESADHNLAACDSDRSPQSAVVSLSWDTNVDLDLIVITPSGKVVSSKSPTTIATEGEIDDDVLEDEATGVLSRDSNKNCDIDGVRRESLVFSGEPPAGEYLIYASLFAPCGQSTVNYGVTLYERVLADDGSQPVERTDLAAGALLALQATGGETLGTYVTTVTLP